MHDNLLKSDYNRDSHISFGISTSRDNYSEKKDLEKKEGLDSMSLVGIFLFPDAVMAFGGSRGTLKDELGNMREEKGRTVQKVFRCNDIIITTFGCNTIMMDGKRTFMEDYINGCIKKDIAVFDIMEDLQKRLAINDEGIIYEFIIAGIEDGRTYYRYIVVSKNDVSYKARQYYGRPWEYVISGPDAYRLWFNGMIKECGGNSFISYSPENVKGVIEEKATEKIMEFENRCHYSPVGLLLRFEIIKF